MTHIFSLARGGFLVNFKNIVVTPYNPDWPHIFEKEASKIKEAIGSNCIAIHHIGSTSVPGLSAKPVIDMIGGELTEPTH